MKYLLILLCYLPIIAKAQGFIATDTLLVIPPELTEMINGEIKSSFSIDFTGDGKVDYLVTAASEGKLNDEVKEYWITSSFELFREKKKFNADIEYYHFVNLDQDPEPEIFSAIGYEDGIDYGFFDLNIKLGTEELIFYFNPVIIENDKYYWGYPWDIGDLIIKKNSEGILIQSSVDHHIIRDGNITFPSNQPHFPVIFFSGNHTQPYEVTEIKSMNWLTIEELKREAQKSR
ncbi:MAG: hypothetical protein CMO01_12995 [Thalassobius sp.]|nr:hypothetical protein [Thalassovita sp.]